MMNDEASLDNVEKKLVALIQKGDRSAFDEVFTKYWKELLNYSCNILGDASLAEDVIQDVFVSIWVNRERMNVYNLKAYLFTACRNRSLSQIRKEKFTEVHENALASIVVSPNVMNTLNAEDLKRVIEEAASQLPKRCREIFYMSRFEFLTIQEIAERLDISHRTVENQLSIALKHIRSLIKGYSITFFMVASCFYCL